jgi:hypothetical protein
LTFASAACRAVLETGKATRLLIVPFGCAVDKCSSDLAAMHNVTDENGVYED